MSRQVKINREKNLDPNPLLDKILSIREIELGDFALKCTIAPDTLRAALRRKKLSKDIITKIHDNFYVRKKYWADGKEPIFIEKPTPAIKTEQADILDHPLVLSLKGEINSLNKLVALQEEEIRRLRGK